MLFVLFILPLIFVEEIALDLPILKPSIFTYKNFISFTDLMRKRGGKLAIYFIPLNYFWIWGSTSHSVWYWLGFTKTSCPSFKFFKTFLSRNMFKNFEEPSQILPEKALIFFYLLWFRHFQAMWVASFLHPWVFSVAFGLFILESFRLIFLTNQMSLGWYFTIFQKETKNQK